MKRCNNPECDSAFLFGDDKTVCPFCRRPLVINGAETTEVLLRPADRITLTNPIPEQPVHFVQERLWGMECHGRIVEIDHQELFNSKRLKLFNTLFRGEPYQLAHQTIEYTIRVESMEDGIATELKDFCLYGSYLGRMQVGDEVVIRAKDLRNRRVVKSIYNQTTGSVIKPGFQIPAWLVRIQIVVLLFIMVAIMVSIGWLIESGTAAILLAGLLATIIPVVVMVWLLWEVFKGIFRR